MAKKCTNMKTRVIWRVFEKPSAYAKPHASDVRNRKNDRRYVKDGSGLCQVFLVSRVLSVSYVGRAVEGTYVSVNGVSGATVPSGDYLSVTW